MFTIMQALLVSLNLVVASALASPVDQHALQHDDTTPPSSISTSLFASLERLSRLVDITYCVGTTGISRPFSCVSRCKDFPSLELVTTWNTGVLMTDSCGYIAVDHNISQVPGMTGQTSGEGGALVVAFRGTYSITNTVIDLSTVPQEYVPYPPPGHDGHEPSEEPQHQCLNCTVHMGFLASWNIARKEVLSKVKPLHEQYPKYPIYLVGHSLGGAVAALAALELKVILGWENIVVTTFGEPRVGNEGFADYLDTVFELKSRRKRVDERTFRRITHVDDPIPLLPLSEWGYRSHSGEFFISKAELSPEPSDIRPCVGDYDPKCIAGSAGENEQLAARTIEQRMPGGLSIRPRGLWEIPTRYKLWELLFAHRDYFWRLGLCIPGGDPIDWGRNPYPTITSNDEL
ncbi:alpha/beta-hydrolase [Xylariaceae sp. FL0016]|nr:alpha/beta-hydrolase [Xylariaceae sp. FL0016]